MTKTKFVVGEAAEVKCWQQRNGEIVEDWLAGVVVEADNRMAAIRFEREVFTANGWPVADRILWCAHGSPKLRRPSPTE